MMFCKLLILFVEFIVTNDYERAFQNADYLLLMSNSKAQEYNNNLQYIMHVFEKVYKTFGLNNHYMKFIL